MNKIFADKLMHVRFSLLVAAVAMGGSLYFSEVVGWTPCELCWYQRILMYPLVLILGVALLHKDTTVHRYVLPMTIIGGAIALYHYLLQWGVVTAGTCGIEATSCAVGDKWFGFVTIPLLALIAFVLIGISVWKLKVGDKN